MKDILKALFLILFIKVSILYIYPETKKAGEQTHSSQLKKIVTEEGNRERTDYVDADGQLTVAADLRFATILVTKGNNYKLEEFFDEKGKPTTRYSGEWAMLREYDDQGNNIRNTSLDAAGHPVMNTSGYAIEEREYNDKGQVAAIWYFDTESSPVCTPANGYGRINTYDENSRVCRITYVNVEGEPMMTGQGYAMVIRKLYPARDPNSGKVESELYLNTEEKPVSLSLGQYGVHKEYDEQGRESIVTYLDAEGKPAATNKGYTTIHRYFWPDNSVAREMYYDSEGKPFALSEGQYGIKRENGNTFYLDENGNEQFNLKNLLYNRPQFVILFAVAAVLLSAFFSKRWNIFFLILSIATIAYMTLMFRDHNGRTANLELFWSYRKMLTDSAIRADVLKNIWLFIPLGAILYRIHPKSTNLLVPLLFSVLVELVQYFTGTGLCELDDIISNSLGGFIGFEAGKLLHEVKGALFNQSRRKRSRV